MKKLIYVAAYILALGFVACASDDGEPIDCGQTLVKLAELGNAYREDASIDNCNAYRSALESYLNNSCSLNDEEKLGWEKELAILGDCTTSGIICRICSNSDVSLVVCRGLNGNAYIDNEDIGIPFAKYVELSTCLDDENDTEQ